MGELRAMMIDWGGVLTQPMRETVRAWITADQIDWERYLAVVGPWLTDAYAANGDGGLNPVHALERGECTVAEFETLLAGLLVRTDGGPVLAEGLLTRMLSAGRPVPAMYQLIRDLRARGVRTALLSNSWGPTGYPREDFPHLFDAVVISGEVGMRKPEPRIFRHAAELLDLEPEHCVFVDDLEANVTAAVGCGMTGVHHTAPALTQQRLTELFANRQALLYEGGPTPVTPR
jgi:epoxide hydrolase-like predicted phosphatase